MSRKVTQEQSTRPRAVDDQGRTLDQWGLPVSGVARARRLAELGRSDPNSDPAGWQPGGIGKASRRTAKTSGRTAKSKVPAIGGRKGKVIVDEAAGFAVPLAPAPDGSADAAPSDIVTENGNG